MKWTVKYSKRAAKQSEKLPKKVLEVLDVLIAKIELSGPVRGDWPIYSKLGGMVHHCHIKKGHPTYVTVWEEDESGIRLV